MITVALAIFLVTTFFVGKYFGYLEGLSKSHQMMGDHQKDFDSAMHEVHQIKNHALDMKMAYLERIHQKFEVHILIKDPTGVVVETVELK